MLWLEDFWRHFSDRREVAANVGLARNLLIVLWRLVTLGEVPEGAVLKSSRGERNNRVSATVVSPGRLSRGWDA